MLTRQRRVAKRARAFWVGFGPGRNLKNCRASIGSDAGAKSKFSVSDRVFVIAGIKQREHLVASISACGWCDCGLWMGQTLFFFFY